MRKLLAKTEETIKRNGTGTVADVEIITDVIANDIAVLRALLRNRFGVDDNRTFRQKQKETKTNFFYKQTANESQFHLHSWSDQSK